VIDLYYRTTSNGHKVTMCLEELGHAYKIISINISKGDQFRPEFLAMSPNNRLPAIVDHKPKGGGKPISVFESDAILMFRAEKAGKPSRKHLSTQNRSHPMTVLANGRSGPNGGPEPSL